MSRRYQLPSFREGQALSARELNKLVEAIRDIDSRMRVNVQGGLVATWGESLCIGASQRQRPVASDAAAPPHPFQIGTYANEGSTLLSVKGGVVNNSRTLGDEIGIPLAGAYTYPAVSVGFDIQADGTVIPSSASFTAQYDPDDDHITISGSSVTVLCFLGKVTNENGVVTIEQWVTANFFVIPLGRQKQMWYG